MRHAPQSTDGTTVTWSDDLRSADMGDEQVTVAVTGAGGLLGRRLIDRLLADPAVDRVVALDVRVDGLPSDARLERRTADIRDPRFAEHLDGVGVLFHLAFILDPIRDESRMREVNVEGTHNVFEAAVEAEVGKVVYTSSAVAYGAHPDNDLPLHEGSPLRANPGFNYAEHKRDVERWLWPWLEDHPDLTVTVLRPAIVAGRGIDNFITRQLELLRPVAIRGYRPPLQFVHVDDVVSALLHAFHRDLGGAYNVAAEGWLSHDEVAAITRRRPVDLPEEVAFTVTDRLWELGLAEAPPGELHYLMHPWVVSVDELVATGWSPRYTNREALAELVEDHRPYVTLARGVRLRRRDLYVGLVGAAVAAAAGTVAVVRRLVRRRHGE